MSFIRGAEEVYVTFLTAYTKSCSFCFILQQPTVRNDRGCVTPQLVSFSLYRYRTELQQREINKNTSRAKETSCSCVNKLKVNEGRKKIEKVVTSFLVAR